ncbi:hypothetical protein HELRODRAFT_80423 [Helobdella robusta]|uniref:Bromo domain-containing protein n=1 Tax=Helobdella robusta TaxID=6412 RepID=T1G404_HELRO|nr:hypothetical protein HELRODRAFT_80423 [Helobdella robusta]ESO03377.1 hypothetical protein HELRODRAFT_80423 [Helobdella robusta]
MTNQLQYILKSVIKQTMNQKVAGPFLRPVDGKIYVVCDYYDVIKSPVDLSSIKKRLTNRQYQNASQCIADFRQMFANCITYNQDKNDVRINHFFQFLFV